MEGPDRLVAVCVGNTRTRYGAFDGRDLSESAAADHRDLDQLAGAIAALARPGAAILMASVNPRTAEPLEARLAAAAGRPVLRLRRDVPVDLKHTLRSAESLGQDRILCAIAAHARAGQACVVIDAGTAVTVDFVDGAGVFHGGVIAPGLAMSLRALHQHTAALPEIAFEPPDPADDPFGRDTPSAMRRGARDAIVGLVHLLIDRYAEFFGAYPQVVATGGDAPALFADDPLVEHVVPDLQLMGLHEAWRRARASDPADAEG